jgi:mannose-1-phosphate guanylyltransferase
MFAVVMAGGKGARFWPRSREHRPKHLLDIAGERTLIRQTVDRLRPLVPPERTLIVTGRSHAAELIRQLPEIPAENILIEPLGRNTAPCIGLAALHIRRRVGDDVMLVLPADHRIGDEEEFRRVLITAAAAAAGTALVTVGIEPTGPETGYGYIEQGAPLAAFGGRTVYRVRSIREKPPRPEAERFLAQGGFCWNSGMFVWKVSTILAAIDEFLPELARGLERIAPALDTRDEERIVAEVYAGLQAVSIDYGVMEKAREVLVLPGAFDWSDLGSWDALWETAAKDAAGNAFRGEVIALDSAGSLVHCPERLVALVGVRDLLVVETPDALLICRRGRSQEVRRIVDTLAEKGLTDHL